MELKIFRTAVLPAIEEREAHALYLTRDTNSGELVLHATNSDNTAIFKNVTAAQVAAMIDAAVPETADALTTARSITATGDASWTVNFDGSENVSAALTLANTGVAAGEYSNLTVDAKGRLTAVRAINGTDIGRGAANGVASLDGAGLVPASQLPSYVDDVIEVDAYDKLPGEVNDPGTNGAASAGKIYVVVEGGTTSIYRWSGSAYIEIPTGVGLADSALKLETARSLTATGDASWTVNFDGTANVSAALTLANSGVAAGAYSNVTVDAKGRVTDIRAINGTDIGRGVADGVASLDADGLVPMSELNKNATNVYYTNDYNTLPGRSGDTGAYGTPNVNALYGLRSPYTNAPFDTSMLAGTTIIFFRWTGLVYAVADAHEAFRATQLKTARDITVTGDASWTVNFNGSANVSAALTLANSGVVAGEYSNVTVDAKGRVTDIRAINGTDIGRGVADGVASLDSSGLVPASQLPSYVDDVIEVDAYDKLPGEVNDPGTNGAASAGKIYVVVEGGETSIYRWSGSAYIEIPTGVGLADSALKLETARNITATGDASWTVSFDGTANASAALTLANTGVAAGAYTNVTVDAKGRVTDIRAITPDDVGRGDANGVASLDADGLVPMSELNPNATNVYYTDDLNKFPGNPDDDGSLGTANTNALYGLTTPWTNTTLDTTGWPAGPAIAPIIFYRWTGSGYRQVRVHDANQAARLSTPRDITATGDASWTVNFNGSTNVSAALTLAATGVGAGEYSNITVDAKGRVTAIRAINGADIGRGVADGVASLDSSGLVPASQLPSYVDDVIEVDAYDKLPGEVNDPGTNGAASAGKIYVVVEGGTTSIYRWSGSAYIEIPTGVGLADSALKLETARNITVTGDASWTVSFDGTANVSAALTLANSGVVAGVYNNIEVDAKGRVIDARELEATDIPTLTYLQVDSARALYVEGDW